MFKKLALALSVALAAPAAAFACEEHLEQASSDKSAAGQLLAQGQPAAGEAKPQECKPAAAEAPKPKKRVKPKAKELSNPQLAPATK